jgi:hypothetical protein
MLPSNGFFDFARTQETLSALCSLLQAHPRITRYLRPRGSLYFRQEPALPATLLLYLQTPAQCYRQEPEEWIA